MRRLFADVQALLRFVAACRAEEEARWERRLRLALRAGGVHPEVASVWLDALHPAGLRYPLSDRKSRKRRRRPPAAREVARWYVET